MHYDGLLVTAYIVWVPSFVVNILHFRNMKSIEKMEAKEREEK